MFFHLFYNSKFFFSDTIESEQKLLKTFIYGTVLYIITHGFMHYLTQNSIIKNYFWIILSIDIITLGALFIINDNGKTTFNVNNESLDIKKITEFSPQPSYTPPPPPQHQPYIQPTQPQPSYIQPPQPSYIQQHNHNHHIFNQHNNHNYKKKNNNNEVNTIKETQYKDNKYKLSNSNINEFENFINTLQPDTKKPNLNEISEIKNNIETKSLEKVNNVSHKAESDLDFDLDEFTNSI